MKAAAVLTMTSSKNAWYRSKKKRGVVGKLAGVRVLMRVHRVCGCVCMCLCALVRTRPQTGSNLTLPKHLFCRSALKIHMHMYRDELWAIFGYWVSTTEYMMKDLKQLKIDEAKKVSTTKKTRRTVVKEPDAKRRCTDTSVLTVCAE
jgi:hypothetical protein